MAQNGMHLNEAAAWRKKILKLAGRMKCYLFFGKHEVPTVFSLELARFFSPLVALVGAIFFLASHFTQSGVSASVTPGQTPSVAAVAVKCSSDA